MKINRMRDGRSASKNLALTLVIFAVTASAQSASAQTLTVSNSDTTASATTNWSKNLTLDKFDGSLGTLTSIKFSYGGGITGSMEGESLDGAPVTLVLSLGADLIFSPSFLDTVNVSSSQSKAVGAFDGIIDFGGTSGFRVANVSESGSNTFTLTSGFAPYIGSGTFDIGVDANAASFASGAGNLVSQFATHASANMTVEYTYEAVPEPSSLALIGLSLASLGLVRRR